MKQTPFTVVALSVAAALSIPVHASGGKSDETMVVSGSRMAQKLEDVSGPITVITDKQIEEQGVTNAAELFRYEPGVSVKGGNGGDQTFIIRGMGENRVKVIQDGVRQNDAYSKGGVGQAYFDTDMIKQVEVVKGPASAAYGSDAMGGAIAITTKEAGDFLKGRDHYLDVTAGYAGANGQGMGGFTGALRTGEVESLLRYTHRDGGVTQDFHDAKNDFDIVSEAILLKSRWQLSEAQHLKLTVNYLTEGQDPEAVKLNKVGGGRARVFEQPITDKQTDNLSLILDHGLELNRPWADRIDSKLYYSDMEQTLDQFASSKYPVMPGNPYVTKNSLDHNRFRQESLGAQMQFSKALASQRLAWGLEYEHTDNRRERYKGPGVPGDFPGYDELSFPSTVSERGGIWAFDEIRFAERWVLTPGVRYDYYRMTPDEDPAYRGQQLHSFSEGEFSPKLGLVFKAHEAANLFAQYSHGFKAPMYDTAFSTLNHQAYGYRFEPNPNLEAETSDGVDVGIRGNTERLGYEVAAFYTRYENFISQQQIATEGRSSIYQYQNLDEVKTRGLEARADYWVTDSVNLWGNLAYVTGKDGDGHYINELSPLQGSLGARLDQTNWNLNTALRFADDMKKVGLDASGKETLKSAGWGVVDVYAQFTPMADLQLNVGVFNLFDKEVLAYESVAGLAQGSDTSRQTDAGRNLSARVKYAF
ncbi:TonB-dependent hemoglobin/transferrin/lactoferrin family receptor [Aeromonas diversa]|uniref:TonB-dependent hemoglobin/transferrin/lactoferrin family receptor n=1 Tax=Aeromonas diversa TaxID=502790 RepID=UPI0034636580